MTAQKEINAWLRAQPPEWPEARVHQLMAHAERLLLCVQRYDVLPSLYAIYDIREALTAIAGDVVEIAGAETTIPAKKLAEALGIPPSTLRGLRATR